MHKGSFHIGSDRNIWVKYMTHEHIDGNVIHFYGL